MTGTRALDETRVGLAAGLAGGLALLATGASATMSAWSIWVWGVATPMTLAGIAAHYYVFLRNQWNAYWQQSEQSRQAFPLLLSPSASPMKCSVTEECKGRLSLPGMPHWFGARLQAAAGKRASHVGGRVGGRVCPPGGGVQAEG